MDAQGRPTACTVLLVDNDDHVGDWLRLADKRRSPKWSPRHAVAKYKTREGEMCEGLAPGQRRSQPFNATRDFKATVRISQWM